MKFFNTEGPIQSDIHYYLSPLERFDKEDVLALIAARKYFVLLVIFDRRRRKRSDKIFRRTRKHKGHSIAVWGM